MRNPRLLLAIAGCLGWLEFVLSDTAQRWQWVPWIGWGLGHGFNLFCAIGGTALLLAAFFVKRRIADS